MLPTKRAVFLAALVAVLELTACWQAAKPIHATWDGERFSCPAGTDLWASEPEALEGRSDYVYCVKR